MATDANAHPAKSLHAKPAPTIKVVGLPATASRQDVVNFFGGIDIPHGADSVTIITEQDNSTSAVVQLANAQAHLQAISRNNTLFGDIPVHVLPFDAVQEAVVSAAAVAGSSPFTAQQQGLLTASQHEQPGSIQQPQSFPFDTGGSTLKLRGLPYSADESDVIAFFEGGTATTPLHLPPNVILCCRPMPALEVSHTLPALIPPLAKL